MTTLFISGIDTDIGKTYACGALAKRLLDLQFVLYTQKLVETGCAEGVSNDLLMHEKIVGKSFNKASLDEHCPYRFTLPASPHLAAEKDQQAIDIQYLKKQMESLASQVDHLLVEGAGGLCVPLTNKAMIVDFIQDNKLPVVLVTSGRLGSINHTVLSLALCRSKNIDVRAIIYNHYPNVPAWMFENTREILKQRLKASFSKAIWLELAENSDVIHMSVDEAEILLGSGDCFVSKSC